MRISLTNKITFALVVFGLVPASIIAWFAYNSNDEYRRNQTLLIKQAAISISDRVAAVLQQDPTTAPALIKEAIDGTLPNASQDGIRSQINSILNQLFLENSLVYIFTSEGKVLITRKPYGDLDANLGDPRALRRYTKVAENGTTCRISSDPRPSKANARPKSSL